MLRIRGRVVAFGLFALALGQVAHGEEADTLPGGFTPKTLDGAEVRAIERFVSPGSDELSLATGIYPFNSYYFGFAATLAYAKYFSESFAWEIVNASYVSSVDKSLTRDLADNFGVSPQQINRLKSVVSSNVFLPFFYGKGIFAGKHIRYFRTSLIAGGGMVQTSQRVQGAVNAGLKLDFYASERMSWRLEFRNSFAFGGGDSSSLPSFSLGVGFGL